MRVLVTGGSGFIGTNLVEYFAGRGDEVLNIDVAPPRNRNHQRWWHSANLIDGAATAAAVDKFSPNLVFHMAARTDLDGHSLDDYAANTIGVGNLIASMERLPDLKRVVFASSRLVCRIGYEPRDEFDVCPTTHYGKSKVIGEQLVRDAAGRLPGSWLIVRPTSIWGPWFDIPYKGFFLAVARGRYVHPGSQRILKSFGFVGNTIHQLSALSEAPHATIDGKTLYLGDYPPTDVAEMADLIQKAVGSRPIRKVGTHWLAPAAWAGDLFKMLGWRDPPLTSFRLRNLLTPMIHDLSELEAIVGKLPYSLAEGVAIAVEWLKGATEVS